MSDRVVLVVDADRPLAHQVVEELGAAGFSVAVGARDQVRLTEVPESSVRRLTVPVMDEVDAEVVLSTVRDAVGTLVAVVVVVSASEGKPEAQVSGVAAAMALSMGLAAACGAAGIPLHVVGPGAAAVVAWVDERLEVSARVGLPVTADESTRRRDRVVQRARRMAQRVLSGRLE